MVAVRATGLPANYPVTVVADAFSNLNVSDEVVSHDEESSAQQNTVTSKKTAASKNKKKALAVKRLGGADDIVFASASNIDHSVEKPFLFNVQSVLESVNTYNSGPPPLQDELPEGVTSETYGESVGLPHQPQLAVARSRGEDSVDQALNMLSVFGFGSQGDDPDEPWALIICDAVARLCFKGHPMLREPLLIEPHVSKIPLRIKDIPGRGKGLVALHDIPQGEVFLREPPLIVSRKEWSTLEMINYDRILESAHPRVLVAFDALMNCKPYTGPLVSRRNNILRTNGFALDFTPLLGSEAKRGSSPILSGVMQIMSRANHSCFPNTSFKWDWKSFQGRFTANRLIKAGEEVTVTYLDPNAPKAMRRKELEKKYFFTCTCERCGPA